MKGILGTKVGMTQVFNESGDAVPVTIVQAGPCVVIAKRTPERNGYSAIQVGFRPKQEKRLNKPDAGVFKKAGVQPMEVVREFRLAPEEMEGLNVGDEIKVDIFRKGQFVDVTGTTKGRGFAGVVKRFGMKGAARDSASTHEHHRHIGAIGARKTPGRVWKGRTMPGHMGVVRRTIQNLQVVDIDLENNLILLWGAVPGHRNGLIEINPSIKGKPDRVIGAATGEGEEKKKGPARKK
ncbi:MAG: 50S ribosomal protein L3 [Myxococcales bacterium]|jgi:large subunit ribosomal protein L3